MTRKLTVSAEDWPLRQSFQITGHVFHSCSMVVVHLTDGTCTGRGEATGIYYQGDTPARLAATIESVRPQIEAGLTRAALAELLPPGGARNALDCALWDLESQQTGRPVWALAGLPPPRTLLTTCTVGAGEPAAMAAAALAYQGARAIKLKLLGDGGDEARVQAVRDACPTVRLVVDANQGFTRQSLDALWPALLGCRVELVEQPFPAGDEHLLDDYERRIPIAADESAQALASLAALKGRFDVVNIKLDKCGGLTEALQMAHEAKALGLQVMVGNMTGTSLGMAPAFILGQLCDIVDLDGPLFLAEDRGVGLVYEDGMVTIPESFWGGVMT
jgi:L-alanine-DL-glutamate epimerase-like enolase superfamily enzyme